MSDWVAVSRSQHADKHFLPRDGYTFALDRPVIGILIAELAKLLPHYALGFIEQGDGFLPVALCSLDGKTNLYIAENGKWLGNYVPAAIRGYPFTLANTDDGQIALCVNAEHLTSGQGEPLFTEDGELGQTAAQTLDFLEQCEKNRELTAVCTAKLAEAGVIEPWPLTIQHEEGQEPLKLNGLFRVNEQAVNSLTADALHALRGGPLSLAYAQLFSMSQLHQLSDRLKFHAEQGHLPQQSLEELFGNDDDDLTFDFN
ncbi:SapC family protein [Halomonas hibernica]|uniref:SapC family protein n=1 Tax=Halomonas hibernica TaxID=2591147 RepID=UPI001552C3E7|nr:SapC family protein [Halomonas hibernica]